jgi:hypothetical protein
MGELWVGDGYVAVAELREAHEALMRRYVGVLGEAARLAPTAPRSWLSAVWKLWPFRVQFAITRLFVWSHLKRMSGALIVIYGQLQGALPHDGEAVDWLRSATEDLTAFRAAIPGFFVRRGSPALIIPVLTLISRWMTLGVFMAYVLLGLGCIPAYLLVRNAFTLKRKMFLGLHGDAALVDDFDLRADTVAVGVYGLEDDLFALLDRPKRREGRWELLLPILLAVLFAVSYMASAALAVHDKEGHPFALSRWLMLAWIIIAACGAGIGRQRKLRERRSR